MVQQNLLIDISILSLSLIFISMLMWVYRKHHCIQDPILEQLKRDMLKLDPRARNLDFFAAQESFTEDKVRVYMCLKDKDKKYYSYNMLVYVAIHELAHAITKVIDVHHVTPEFNNAFNGLLKKAEEIGIYDSKQPIIQDYCKYNK